MNGLVLPCGLAASTREQARRGGSAKHKECMPPTSWHLSPLQALASSSHSQIGRLKCKASSKRSSLEHAVSVARGLPWRGNFSLSTQITVHPIHDARRAQMAVGQLQELSCGGSLSLPAFKMLYSSFIPRGNWQLTQRPAARNCRCRRRCCLQQSPLT